jgi:hypothetical protein
VSENGFENPKEEKTTILGGKAGRAPAQDIAGRVRNFFHPPDSFHDPFTDGELLEAV